MRPTRTLLQRTAATFEEEMSPNKGKKITYDSAQKRVGQILVAEGHKASGTSSNVLVMLEYTGFLHPVIAPGRERPHEYIIGRNRDLQTLSLTELSDLLGDVGCELTRRVKWFELRVGDGS